MRAGRLRHRVVLQRRSESQGTTGEVTWGWATLATVWASVEPVTGRQFFAAAQVQSEVDTLIRIRYRPKLNEKLRAVFIQDSGPPKVTQYFDVLAVLPIHEGRHEVHLMCKRSSSEGFAYDGN
jgi:SPP1 family predicted phage head-tail adaptor